ncbi:negative regulator of differentiation 1 [Neocallimastix lanati (nom. inval.)]|jgi:RNA recognition motif-containing protein|nr:negative regulator of differentiation 1 [Neocallimastix sp. JGI-2020a]
MKRSSDYSSQSQDNHKKQRFNQSSFSSYSSNNNSNLGMGFSQSGSNQEYYSQVRQQYMNNPSQYSQSGASSGSSQYGSMSYQNSQYPSNYQSQYQNVNQYMSANQYQSSQYQQGQYGQSSMMINPSYRTIYVGNLAPGTTYEELLNHIRGGIIDNVKIIEDKNCAFITFVEASAAASFQQDANSKRIVVKDNELKFNWGKPSQISPNILVAVNNQATRTVYIGNIDETVTESFLQEELSKFGIVESIKILPEKHIAFVYMTSVSAAIKAVQTLPNDSKWANRRVNYGKDRCAVPIKPNPNMMYGNGYSQYGSLNYQALGFDMFNGQNSQMSPIMINSNPTNNRTIFLGNLHPETTAKDICDVVRGGILQDVKYKPDKAIAFVTFIDPNAATAFYNRAQSEGLSIKKRMVKVGWGKMSTQLNQQVAKAVQNNASRNVYLGNINETITEEKLKQDFSEYGEVELINIVPDKNIAFVNFTDILSAVKAVEGIQNKEDYKTFKVGYGKDRCGNPPRERFKKNNDNRMSNGTPTSSNGNNQQSINGDNSNTNNQNYDGIDDSNSSNVQEANE